MEAGRPELRQRDEKGMWDEGRWQLKEKKGGGNDTNIEQKEKKNLPKRRNSTFL